MKKSPKLITRIQLKFAGCGQISLYDRISVKSNKVFKANLREMYPDCESILLTYEEEMTPTLAN